MANIIAYHQSIPVSERFPKGVNCPDGIFAASIVADYVDRKGETYQLIGDSYRKPEDYETDPSGIPKYSEIVPGVTLWIVDFSYPRRWLDYWAANGVTIKLFDHHADKFPMIGGFSGAVLDEKECGATLVYKTLYPTRELPEVLKHVRNRDIGLNGYYEGANRFSEAVNAGLSHLRATAEDEVNLLSRLIDPQLPPGAVITTLRDIGEPLLIERDRVVSEACSRATIETIEGFEVPSVLVDDSEGRYSSIIGNQLALQYPNKPFAVIRFLDGGMSLRSSRASGFDVRPIAKSLGGGGHKHASGVPGQNN